MSAVDSVCGLKEIRRKRRDILQCIYLPDAFAEILAAEFRPDAMPTVVGMKNGIFS